MPTFKHLINYIQMYKLTRKPLYMLGFLMLFWALYEGIISYITPIVITNSGLSKTMMGIIIGSSSIAGALFDFVSCRLFTNTYYKRLFVIMFALCLIYPLILFQANSFVVYLLAMSIWGVYYDLKNIANFDYVGRFTKKSEHTDNFGIISVFQSVGLLLAPIIVGILVADALDWKPFVVAWIFLLISIFFFIVLVSVTKKHKMKEASENAEHKRTTWAEVVIWGKIGRIILPVLFLTLFLNFLDAFFWTVGPIFAEDMAGDHHLAGFFMTAYSLPALLVGWYVGTLTRKFGKKRTAFTSLMIGSLLLSLIYFLQSPFLTMLIIFLSSIFISMAWPAINGAYADYISETAEYEKEIEGLEDFYTNLGYVMGPMMAGFLADILGNSGAFSLLGLSGFFIGALLLAVTPKKINVLKRMEAK